MTRLQEKLSTVSVYVSKICGELDSKSCTIIYPGETPWWKIEDSEERTKANRRQRRRWRYKYDSLYRQKAVDCSKRYEELNPQKRREYYREYYRNYYNLHKQELNERRRQNGSKKCPVCGSLAISPHHITPRAENGSDKPINKVYLCKKCHDKVEEIYCTTGEKFSPNLVRRLRLSFAV